MAEWLTSLGDWRKIGATLSGVVALVTGIVLFAPDPFVAKTGLLEVRDDNLAWIGLAFLAAIALFFAAVIETIWKVGKKAWEDSRIERNLAETLGDLTEDQKELLRELIVEGKSTIYRPPYDGTSGYLLAMKVLVRTSNLSTHSGSFPYGLQPWAKRALKKNPKLLD